MSWRADQAVLSGGPDYRVLTAAAVLALVAQAPADLTALGQVPGIGPVTLARHGQDLLSLVRPLAA